MPGVSAFIAAVPEAEPFVETLRRAHDPSAADGVPAHITLLHPFRALDAIDADARTAVARIAARTAPFAFALARVDRFPGVLYLAPEPAAPFVALTRALAAAFPSHPPYGGRHADVVPHLTVAKGDEALLEPLAHRLRAALPASGVAARCTEIMLIANDTGRWRRVDAWALAGTGAESAAAPRTTDSTEGGRRR